MQLYAFQGRYGGDKVCRTEQEGFKIGDLLIGNQDMYLVIGNQQSKEQRAELNSEQGLIKYAKYKITDKLELNHKGFFSKETVQLIHRMAHEYYTSYKNVVKLFVTGELADLFKKELTVKKKSFFSPIIVNNSQSIEHRAQSNIEQSDIKNMIDNAVAGQQLIVFPDVRTMINTLQKAGIEEKTGVAVLNSTSTQQQKDKVRRGIKMGHINTLICTYSQIFQERKDLKTITLIDSHQWYYKSQQDPRYDTREVVKKMAELYKSELVMTGVQVFK